MPSVCLAGALWAMNDPVGFSSIFVEISSKFRRFRRNFNGVGGNFRKIRGFPPRGDVFFAFSRRLTACGAPWRPPAARLRRRIRAAEFQPWHEKPSGRWLASPFGEVDSRRAPKWTRGSKGVFGFQKVVAGWFVSLGALWGQF